MILRRSERESEYVGDSVAVYGENHFYVETVNVGSSVPSVPVGRGVSHWTCSLLLKRSISQLLCGNQMGSLCEMLGKVQE